MHKYRGFALFACLLTVCFTPMLVGWVRFALHSSLFSYVLLVPFISGYLVWVRRKSIVRETKAAPLAAAALGGNRRGVSGRSHEGICGKFSNPADARLLLPFVGRRTRFSGDADDTLNRLSCDFSCIHGTDTSFGGRNP